MTVPPHHDDDVTAIRRTAEEELDLSLAAEMQAALLPKSCPTDCPNHVAAARNRMCGSVGGDFYDFLRINDDQIALVIGDVVGHGIRAALMMSQIMGFLRSQKQDLARPVPVIAALNRMLIDLGDRIGSVTPCTIFYAVIDSPTGLCLFVNAGHPQPFLCDQDCGTAELLGAHDLLLGVEDFVPTEGCHSFTPKQRMVLYTDGITETTNTLNDHFGRERLQLALCQASQCDPDTCAEGVLASVDEFRGAAPQNDDMTIVVIDRI